MLVFYYISNVLVLLLHVINENINLFDRRKRRGAISHANLEEKSLDFSPDKCGNSSVKEENQLIRY